MVPHRHSARYLLHTLRGGAAPQLALSAWPSLSTLASLACSCYSQSLIARPVITKSLTAGVTFALSDLTAQRLQRQAQRVDTKRTLTTALIGLLYFGPALHVYLEWLTRMIPGTSLVSTLLKTLVGQLGFGPAVTCVFFGAFLVAEDGLMGGLRQWPRKMRQDLLGVWASELCYWPFVDLLCFSLVPVPWIPLAYNLANYAWTIFLSLRASQKVGAGEGDGELTVQVS